MAENAKFHLLATIHSMMLLLLLQCAAVLVKQHTTCLIFHLKFAAQRDCSLEG